MAVGETRLRVGAPCMDAHGAPASRPPVAGRLSRCPVEPFKDLDQLTGRRGAVGAWVSRPAVPALSQVKTSRRGGSTSRYSPVTSKAPCLVTQTSRYRPPAVGSQVASATVAGSRQSQCRNRRVSVHASKTSCGAASSVRVTCAGIGHGGPDRGSRDGSGRRSPVRRCAVKRPRLYQDEVLWIAGVEVMGDVTAADLAAALQRLKDRKGRSLEALARRLGVSKSALHRYLTGQVVPPELDLVEALARQCDATAGEMAELRRIWGEVRDARLPAGPADVPQPARVLSLPPGSPARQVPRELPAEAGGFVGRDTSIQALDDLLAIADATGVGPVLAAITGTAGVGKTALAVHWGHRVADRFPDGQLYVDLRGFASAQPVRPIEALTALLSGLGVAADQIPVDVTAAAARYRSLVAGRRILLVLDNAASAEQIRPLLPGGPSCFVVITSRNRLTGLVARDGARRFTLEVLSGPESVDLLRRLLGDRRAAVEPDRLVELARRCAHLPLALRIAGARLADQPGRTVGDYADELSRADSVLARMSVDDDEHAAVRGAFELSYRSLPDSPRRMFRLLGLVPCPDFTVPAAATLAGTGDREAAEALDQLAAAHLAAEHRPGRFTLHDLLREFAGDLAATEDAEADRAAARRRLYDWFTAASIGAAELLYPEMARLPRPGDIPPTMPGLNDTVQASNWLNDERNNLVAVVRDAACHGPHRTAWLCADALRAYFDQQRSLTDWLMMSRAAMAAARRHGGPAPQAAAFLALAHTHYCLGHHRRSVTYLRRTVALAAEAGWAGGEAAACHNLGIMLQQQGRTGESIQLLRTAMGLNKRIGWGLGLASVTVSLANLYKERGRLSEGAALAIEARDLYRAHGVRRAEAVANSALAELYHQIGRLDDARALLVSTLGIYRDLGYRPIEASGWACLARVHCDADRLEDAEEAASTALALSDNIGDPRVQADARNALGGTRAAAGDRDGAVRLFTAALAIAERIGTQYLACDALLGLAGEHLAGGDHDHAMRDADRALVLAQQAEFAVMTGRGLGVLAAIHHRLGESGRALRVAARALRSQEQSGHRLGAARTRALMAEIRASQAAFSR
jgi:tetratricopeptide (TPR) repeat protein/transcriptional regulator with XRE-family HTH domain